jgi:hypothetical protein
MYSTTTVVSTTFVAVTMPERMAMIVEGRGFGRKKRPNYNFISFLR